LGGADCAEFWVAPAGLWRFKYRALAEPAAHDVQEAWPSRRDGAALAEPVAHEITTAASLLHLQASPADPLISFSGCTLTLPLPKGEELGCKVFVAFEIRDERRQ